MKVSKLSIILIILSIIICFFITRWYYTEKYREEAIHRNVMYNEYYRILRTSLNDKEQHLLILESFNKQILKFFAKYLDIKYDNEDDINEFAIMTKLDEENYISFKTITPEEFRESTKYLMVGKDPSNPLEEQPTNH